jgi:hypothetical protein
MKLGISSKVKHINLITALAILLSTSMSKAQQVSNTNTNATSRSTFSYSVQSSYGVVTNASASPNFKSENEAILKLKSGSFVTNKFGTDEEKASAVFTATPTGANVSLDGITAKNLLLIDDGTYFRSSLVSVDNPDPNLPMQATASALATHSSSITVERSESNITQSFSTTF